jgi:hypothetical protein
MDALALGRSAAPDLLQIGGLPLHPLIVHAVLVLTPLTVLALVLGAVWPAARRRLGIVTPLGALAVLVLVPITEAAGRSLAERFGTVPAIATHRSFGEQLLPWAIALFVVALAQWAWYRWGDAPVRRRSRAAAHWIGVGLAVASVAVGVGTMWLLVLIGESGARAVWGGVAG